MPIGSFGKWTRQVKRVARVSLSKSAMLYIGFVFIAALLWSFVTLNRELPLENIALNIKIVNMPDGYRFIDSVPSKVMCGFKGQGWSLLTRIGRGSQAELVIDFRRFEVAGENVMRVPSLITLLGEQFSRDGIVVTKLDYPAIEARYGNASKRVIVMLDVHNSTGKTYSDEILLKPDSVTVWGSALILDNIETLVAPLTLEEDRSAYDVPVSNGGNALLIEPSTVHVEVNYVKTLIMRETVVLHILNVPQGLKVTTVPTKFDISYNTSAVRRSEKIDTIAIDYEQMLRRAHDGKFALDTTVLELPYQVQGLALSTDSVEYIIERVQ